MDKKLSIIGAGNMASSIIAGVLQTGLLEPQAIVVTNRSHGKLEPLHDNWAVHTTYDNAGAAAGADTIILAVKPVDIRDAVEQLRGLVNGKLIVTVAAGVGIGQIQGWLGEPNHPVVRVMP